MHQRRSQSPWTPLASSLVLLMALQACTASQGSNRAGHDDEEVGLEEGEGECENVNLECGKDGGQKDGMDLGQGEDGGDGQDGSGGEGEGALFGCGNAGACSTDADCLLEMR